MGGVCSFDSHDSRSLSSCCLLCAVDESRCICCTQVGKLGDAIQEMLDAYHPDRILLETSGSSYPAPLAREVSCIRDAQPIEATRRQTRRNLRPTACAR